MESSTIVWALIVVSFFTFFAVNMVYNRLGIGTLKSALMATNGLRFLNLKHLFGLVLFGVVFYVLLPEFRYLVEYIEIPRLKTLLPLIVILLLVAYLSRASFKKAISGCQTANTLTTLGVWTYLALRFSFLLGSEFFFRGVVLFKFLEFESPIFAIISSTFLYGLIYAFNSQKVFFGMLTLGILLSMFSYLTESIWYAFIIHLTFSAVYEISMFFDLSFNKSACDSKYNQ